MAFLTEKKISILILLFCVFAFSQEITLDLQNIQKTKQEEVSLDLQNIRKTKEESGAKADWTASGLNLVMPGIGHFYLREKKTAISFLSADIVLLSAFFYTNYTSVQRSKSSLGYAKIYAHTQSVRPYDDVYWSYLGNKSFMRTQDLNWAFQNNREFEKMYIDESDFWHWDSEENRDEYANMRQKAQYFKTASTLVLGSLALNRLAAFVSARVATKKYNEKMFSAPIIAPTVDTETKSVGVSFLFGI
jgi:hypothetical protein